MNKFFFRISRQVVNKNIHKYKFDWVPYFNIQIPSYFQSERMISLVSACVLYVHDHTMELLRIISFFEFRDRWLTKNIHQYKFNWVPYFNIQIPSYFLSERMISLVSACVTYIHALFCPQTNNNTPHIVPIYNVSPSLSYLRPRCLPPWSFTDNASLASLLRSPQTIYHHQTRCANKTVSWRDEFCFSTVNISATSLSI